MTSSILIGLGAGAASALLFASAATGTVVGLLVLVMLSPMPIVISGLGWGWGSATVSAATATLVLAIVGGPRAGILHLLAIGLPNAVASYLILLSRPAPALTSGSPPLEWYPLGRLLAWCAGWAGILAIAALLATGPGLDQVRAVILQALDRMIALGGLNEATGGKGLTPEEKDAFASVMLVLLPWSIASTWMTMAVLNLWGGGHVVRVSGRLSRPWPDLAATTLPTGTPLVFTAALALSVMPGYAGLAAGGFASAILVAYMMIGLAVLHTATRGMPTRPFLLSATYLSLLMLSPFSSLLVAMIGLAEPWLPLRRKPPLQPPGPPGPPAT